ncbi:MAG: MMPL family transporter, partial [Verrucomicrobiota bacterium]
EDKHYHRIFLDFRREFAGQDDIVVLVESEDAEKNRQFIERLGARLEAESVRVNPAHVFGDIFYKGDLRAMGNKALLFFPETNLVEFAGALEKYRPFMRNFTGATNLESMFRQVNTLIRQAGRERKPGTEEEFAQLLPAMERLVRMAGESLARPGVPPSPGVEALFGGGAEAERQKYLTFANGRLYLLSTRPRQVEVQPADLPPTLWERLRGRDAQPTPARMKDFQRSRQGSVNSDAVDRVRALVAEVQQEVPGLNVGVTGEQVLDHDEMHQSQADSTLATLLALVICLGIFVAGYRQVWRPLKAMACLVIGLGYTMGYTTLVIGHLNILTVTFVPMLVGLAIDFGVHLITRYEEELGRGRPEAESMRLAVVFTGQGIFTGCFTTAGAFFAMALTGFRGIREMGVITGGGMLLCLVPMITLLPIWLRTSRRPSPAATPERTAGATASGVAAADRRERLERLWLDRPWTVLGVAAAGCAAAALVLPRIHFDYNLLNMQSRGLPAVEFEHKLIEGAEKSVLYAAVVTNSLEGAVALEDRLRRLPTVASTDSMARFLREDATRKLALARQVKAAVAGLQFAPVDPAPVTLEDLSRRVFALQGYLALAADEVNKSGPTDLAPRLRSLGEALARFRADLFQGDRAANARKLAAFQRA